MKNIISHRHSAPALDSESGLSETAPQKKRTILLVEDHPIVRQGLVQMINHEADLEVVGTAENAERALEQISTLRPDLLLLDISLNGASGMDVLKQAKQLDSDLRVLILSMHDERLYAMRALGAGASGYVMKQEATENVLTAIRRVLDGDTYLSRQMEKKSMQQFVGRRTVPRGTPMEDLSKRELQVFELIGQGQRTRQIAELLNLSVKTVESHRQHIKEKLGLSSGHELVQHAIQWHQT